MQFGLLSYAELRPGQPGSFRLLVEEAQAAEAAGFDFYAVIEHHQADDGQFSSPLVWMAGLAAATSRIRIAVAVALLPLYNPVRLAEDLATVDIISDGRVMFGVGLGYQERDFMAFNVPIQERVGRFEETLEILRRAWRPEPVSFQGSHFQLDEVVITPKPLQPSIPLWGGGMKSKAIERLGRLCDGWISGPKTTPSQMEPLVQTYKAAALAAGRQPRIIPLRDCWIADSFEEARAEFGPAITAHYSGIDEHSGSRQVLGRPVDYLPERPTDEHFLIMGNAGDCIRQIDGYRERFGIEGLLLRLRTTYGPDQPKVLRTIERFGREVISHYRRGNG